jgi:hypothetical protein
MKMKTEKMQYAHYQPSKRETICNAEKLLQQRDSLRDLSDTQKPVL